MIHARNEIYKHLNISHFFDHVMMKLICRNGKKTAGKIHFLQGNSSRHNYNKHFGSNYFMLSASLFTAVVLSQSVNALCNDETVVVDDLLLKRGGTLVLEDKDLFEKFLHELRTVLSDDQIELDEEECRLRGKPWSSYHTVTGCPRVIASPSSTEQVILIRQ